MSREKIAYPHDQSQISKRLLQLSRRQAAVTTPNAGHRWPRNDDALGCRAGAVVRNRMRPVPLKCHRQNRRPVFSDPSTGAGPLYASTPLYLQT